MPSEPSSFSVATIGTSQGIGEVSGSPGWENLGKGPGHHLVRGVHDQPSAQQSLRAPGTGAGSPRQVVEDTETTFLPDGNQTLRYNI